jgi:nitric oxide dioxygenase
MALDIALLEASFARIQPRGTEFVRDFYDRLFTIAPDARAFFGDTKMESQHQKLLFSLVLVIENLRRPDVLQTSLGQLGAHHVGYGVQPEHYDLVGAALLDTFAAYLGADWTPDVAAAWTEAYGAIVDMMLAGADASAV